MHCFRLEIRCCVAIKVNSLSCQRRCRRRGAKYFNATLFGLSTLIVDAKVIPEIKVSSESGKKQAINDKPHYSLSEFLIHMFKLMSHDKSRFVVTCTCRYVLFTSM